MAQLFSATGTLEVRQLSLRRAEPLPAFLWVSRSMLGLWVVAGLWVVWPLLAAAARDRRIAAVVLVGLAIGCATQMPNTEKTELLLLLRHAEARIMAELQRAPSAADATAAEDGLAERQVSWQGLDKLGHFLMHVGLGMATLWAFRRQSRALVLSCLLLFSAVTEVWQNFAIDRDPLLSDALINMGGALTGALLVLGARQFRKLQVRPAGPPAA
jgi:VanZ family protein